MKKKISPIILLVRLQARCRVVMHEELKRVPSGQPMQPYVVRLRVRVDILGIFSKTVAMDYFTKWP